MKHPAVFRLVTGGRLTALLRAICRLSLYLLAAMCMAVLIRLFVGEIYIVPSQSMQNTLMPGDVLWVSKLQYGPTLPAEWRDIPFIGNWLQSRLNTNTENDQSTRNRRRLPGLDCLKRGDIIIFRHPEISDQILVKRCVALAGESLQLIADNMYINAQPAFEAGTELYPYYIRHREENTPEINSYLSEKECFPDRWPSRICYLDRESKIQLASLAVEIKRYIPPGNYFGEQLSVYPATKAKEWTRHTYGPLSIPAKHCFLMGDHRHHSKDSRHFGPVSESAIIGKVVCVLWNKHHWRRFWTQVS